MFGTMSDIEISNGRNPKNGQFVVGHSGNGGRRPGARNRLGETFVADLANCWEKHGAAALEACATEEPATFCRIVATLLPKQAELNIDIEVLHDVTSKLEAFRAMNELLGVNPENGLRRLKRLAPQIVDHER
jgi:hypothetical protein